MPKQEKTQGEMVFASSKNQPSTTQQWWQALVTYYVEVDSPPLLGDEAYDALRQALPKTLSPKSSQAKDGQAGGLQQALQQMADQAVQVSPAAQGSLKTSAHSTPMLSLANAYSVEALRTWAADTARALGTKAVRLMAEVKMDGMALALRYKNGQLVQALTRGDGESGEDVLHNAKTLTNLPLTLKQPVSLEVRGEVYLPLAQFTRLNQQRSNQAQSLYKNPRNAAAGALRMLDSTQTAQRGLAVALYANQNGEIPLPNCSTGEEVLQALEALGFPVVTPRTQATSTSIDDICQFYQHWWDNRDTLPFQIDGVVVKLASLAARRTLGSRGKSPRWAIAAKFGAAQAQSVLLGVEVGVGRTGKITPVALLKPVELLGTTVARATLHNYANIEELALCIGDDVLVEKGGDVIPKVVKRAGILQKPTQCPSCQHALKIYAQEVDQYCVNPACPQQREARLFYFVSRKAMDIEGLGPEILRQLLGKGVIHSFADLYQLKAEHLQGLEGMAEKSIQNLLAGIEQSKTMPLARFLTALGIRHLGEIESRLLADHFGSFEALHQACIKPPAILADLPNLPSEVKEAFCTHFSDRQRRDKEVEAIRKIAKATQLFAVFLGVQTGLGIARAQRIAKRYGRIEALHQAYQQGDLKALADVGESSLAKLNTLFEGEAALNKVAALGHITQTYHDFEGFYEACQDGLLRLQQIPSIGGTVAKSVCEYFADDAMRQFAEQCLAAGVTPRSAQTKTNRPLQGKRVVITGTLSQPRTYWTERLSEAGALVSGSVSANTHYLLAGDKAGSKKDKAQQLGVTMVDEAQLEALLSTQD